MAAHPKIVSPTATAAYAWINKPDTKFAKSADEADYKITLLFPKGKPSTKAFFEKILKLGRQDAKDNGINLRRGHRTPWKDGDEIEDRDGNKREDFAGMWLIEAKSRFQPGVINIDKEPLEDGVFVMSGDLVKGSYNVKAYDGFGGGITLKLRSVMLVEKRSFAGDPASDFEDGDDWGDEDAADYAEDDADDHQDF